MSSDGASSPNRRTYSNSSCRFSVKSRKSAMSSCPTTSSRSVPMSASFSPTSSVSISGNMTPGVSITYLCASGKGGSVCVCVRVCTSLDTSTLRTAIARHPTSIVPVTMSDHDDAEAAAAIESFRALSALTVDAAHGTLTLDGLHTLMHDADSTTGVEELEAALEQMFQLMDADGDGIVTEDEFAMAAANEPQLVMFAENIVERCVERHPHKAADVHIARSRPTSPASSAHKAPVGASGTAHNDTVDDGAGHGADIVGGGRETSGKSGGGDAEELARLHNMVAMLQKDLAGKDKEVQTALQRARDLEESYDLNFADLEDQLHERDAKIRKLRNDNARLKDQVATLSQAPNALDGAANVTAPSSADSSQVTSPSSRPSAADRLEIMTAERDLLLKEVETLQADKQQLQADNEAIRKLAVSKTKVSESALQLLEEENVALREQQMELEKLRNQNEMLRDELDEAVSHSRDSRVLEASNDPDDAEGSGAASPDLQFAYDMLQVEVKDLKQELGNTQELRRRLATLDSQVSVKTKQMSALETELEEKATENAALTIQVEALGMSLDKMKAYLDASGAAVAKVSGAKRMTISNKTNSLMKKFAMTSMTSFRRPRSAVSRENKQDDEASELPIDAIPAAPVSIDEVAPPAGSPQKLSDDPDTSREEADEPDRSTPSGSRLASIPRKLLSLSKDGTRGGRSVTPTPSSDKRSPMGTPISKTKSPHPKKDETKQNKPSATKSNGDRDVSDESRDTLAPLPSTTTTLPTDGKGVRNESSSSFADVSLD
eukprot:m.107911 g.107911  ORF g.107911 m.107911 type:complete len:779 (+) comp10638_c0_seq5:268-2604(+)